MSCIGRWFFTPEPAAEPRELISNELLNIRSPGRPCVRLAGLGACWEGPTEASPAPGPDTTAPTSWPSPPPASRPQTLPASVQGDPVLLRKAARAHCGGQKQHTGTRARWLEAGVQAAPGVQTPAHHCPEGWDQTALGEREARLGLLPTPAAPRDSAGTALRVEPQFQGVEPGASAWVTQSSDSACPRLPVSRVSFLHDAWAVYAREKIPWTPGTCVTGRVPVALRA